MVKVINFTPFANLRFSNRNAEGKEFGVFMAKTAMDIGANGECRFSSEQEPFVFTDTFHGDLNVSSLRYPSDFVPYKPHSEIILDATAYAPAGKPAAEWPVSIKVSDDLGTFVHHEMVITGPRQWRPVWLKELDDEQKPAWRSFRSLFRKWTLSSPSPIVSLPIRYEHAFGGTIDKGLDDDGNAILEAFERNPIGRGLIDPEFTDHTQPVEAPQILYGGGELLDAYAQQPVEGLGPIPPAWLPRRPLGGTYDEHWMEHVWPNWAKDYDYRFHNSAHTGLQGSRYLEGAIRIELRNLYPDRPDFTIRLPDDQLVAMSLRNDDTELALKMVLDTVFLEIGERDRDDPRVHCIWRTPYDMAATEGLALLRYRPELARQMKPVRLNPDDIACDPALLDPDLDKEEAA
ncbi:DUF2169 family type VI secretion system accessory protein [Neorhizobium alkalisoli]|uniref:DUF2169 family type VI secretion system accessory protein n=1 Tax=Neorhizobium alkalisoli TaxID=528178 RepID=UPI000CF9AD4F|nr:DUF2169 domain-containing protein [Neorhizobium alkalisoli]